MKHLTFLIALIGLLLHSSASAQSTITYHEASAEPAPKALHSILIMGFGTSATRIFLDEVTSDLIEKCKKKNIKIEYGYYGTDTTAMPGLLASDEAGRFDAVLMLVPADALSLESDVTRNWQSVTTQSFGTANLSFAKAKFGYSQSFRIQLKNSATPHNTLLSASLFVDCNLSRSNAFSKISKKIYDSLISHGYVE